MNNPDYLQRLFQHHSEIHLRDDTPLLGAKICNSLPQFISDTESLSRIKKIIFNNIFNSHSTAQMSVTSCVAFLARRESRSALRDSCSVRIIEA